MKKKQFNRIQNLAYFNNYSIIQKIAIVENFLQANAELELVNAGQSYSVDIPEVENYFQKNNLYDKELYLKNILKKYF